MRKKNEKKKNKKKQESSMFAATLRNGKIKTCICIRTVNFPFTKE